MPKTGTKKEDERVCFVGEAKEYADTQSLEKMFLFPHHAIIILIINVCLSLCIDVGRRYADIMHRGGGERTVSVRL